MIERSIWYFKTRGERRVTKGDKRKRPSTTMWREWKKKVEVRRLTSFERFICERENFVFDSLIYLELVERFKNRSNVMKIRSFGDRTRRTYYTLLYITWTIYTSASNSGNVSMPIKFIFLINPESIRIIFNNVSRLCINNNVTYTYTF